MRAAVRHPKDGGGTVHAQTWQQETPLAETDRKENSREWDYTIQHTGDTLVWRLDDTHLTLKEQHNQCIQSARGTEARI